MSPNSSFFYLVSRIFINDVIQLYQRYTRVYHMNKWALPKISPLSNHMSTHINNDQFPVTTRVTTFERIIPYIFPICLSILVCSYVFPMSARMFFQLPVCLLFYFYSPFKLKTIDDIFEF